MGDLPDPLLLIVVLFGVSAVPFIVIMVTAFIKIVVVLFILRNALGIQQIPPNLVLYGIAIVLTTYVSAPVISEVFQALSVNDVSLNSIADIERSASLVIEPVRNFLIRFAEPDERAFFVETTQRIWPPDAALNVQDDDLVILIPAFVTSELTRAFEIGFLIYLPFLAIDIVMSNILLAMGMIMVSPIMISLPFKLFLFVLVDGWTRLLHGLVLSYG